MRAFLNSAKNLENFRRNMRETQRIIISWTRLHARHRQLDLSLLVPPQQFGSEDNQSASLAKQAIIGTPVTIKGQDSFTKRKPGDDEKVRYFQLGHEESTWLNSTNRLLFFILVCFYIHEYHFFHCFTSLYKCNLDFVKWHEPVSLSYTDFFSNRSLDRVGTVTTQKGKLFTQLWERSVSKISDSYIRK